MKRGVLKLLVPSIVLILAFAVPVKAQETGNKTEDVCQNAEKEPVFPGGEKALREFISNTVKYPAEAQKKGIQGKVYVSYVINTDGSVTDVTVVRSVDPLLDKEAVRVVKKLPKWTPAKEKGKAVKVRLTSPISFVLS